MFAKYRFYGEKVLKQCVESGTHQVDLCGEPEYLERMQLLYGKQAAANGAFIVGSCGFDSVPTDMGVVFTKKNFASAYQQNISIFFITTFISSF